jgi:chromosome partitioning protein
MYVLALVTQKGGSGKSTLAVGLAVAAMENGERVAFVEADPQGTISKWKERRDDPYPRVVRVADPAEIDGALSRLEAEGIWLGIIDTAATNNALALRAIAKADLCLIPVRPSPADIEASIPTLIAIRRLNRRFAFVLNQTPPRGCRLSEAATSLNSLGVLALPLCRTAQRPPRRARDRVRRDRVCARGNSLGGSSQAVALGPEKAGRGVV